ncbi:GNAT family N-acetyltransferase [Mangrovibacillus cuniculi]|uniref:GNAT family N-acetyltransferase n=1 Tax=Mangrovibacillus cuniculi TaxID=2593652 RepID=A0A7S8CE66_9BACI|nr:GNAT family N-acetyltransferase [Mangrovibacillus cuniculi]QPC48345.1 GNAT family N-acetyltransferase [Mangrovibacillus cuniculi]
MDWYEKLNQYFPVEEMKSKQHMESLLKEKKDVYFKEEGPHHVLMYAEFKHFVFVDYLFVSKDARGQGLGKKLMKFLQDKNKPILLEVEPVDVNDEDTAKRLYFYKRIGFKHADKIGYERKSLATGEVTTMEILYWSPTNASEEEIYEAMKTIYEDIHTYKDEEFYKGKYEDVEQVLSIDEKNKENILKSLD